MLVMLVSLRRCLALSQFELGPSVMCSLLGTRMVRRRWGFGPISGRRRPPVRCMVYYACLFSEFSRRRNMIVPP